MSAGTKIQWTDETWNPVTGCTKVSQGCKNCYAETVARRWWGSRAFTEVRTHPERLDQPLRWRKPRRVFVNSMSDLFHEDVPFDFVDSVFATIVSSPQHTFQLLTKRPKAAKAFMDWWQHQRDSVPENLWLGVSVEDQKTADERIPILLETPAAVRFISAEPLLGPIDLRDSWWLRKTKTIHLSVSVRGAIRNRSFDGLQHAHGRPMTRDEAREALMDQLSKGVEVIPCGPCEGFDPKEGCPGHANPRLDWVIVGGESGPGARPCNVEWIRSIVAQCPAAGVPVFVKQLGADPIMEPGPITWPCSDPKGGDPAEWPEDLRIREFPKPKIRPRTFFLNEQHEEHSRR